MRILLLTTLFTLYFGFANLSYGQDNSDVGVVICGINADLICHLPNEICCQGLRSAKCTAPSQCKGFMTAPAYCDGPEDCTGDKPICCAKFSFSGGSGTRCVASCAGTGTEAILCRNDGDCDSPNKCITCSPPGGRPMKMCVETCPY